MARATRDGASCGYTYTPARVRPFPGVVLHCSPECTKAYIKSKGGTVSGKQKQTFVLRDAKILDKAIFVLKQLVKKDELYELIIKPHKPRRDISAEQRGLYFVWMGVIGEELGDTKDYYHWYFKSKFLVFIYRRDDAVFSQTYDALRKILPAHECNERLAHLISITKASKKQMSEYMTDIQTFSNELSIVLPLPDDKLLSYHEKEMNR